MTDSKWDTWWKSKHSSQGTMFLRSRGCGKTNRKDLIDYEILKENIRSIDPLCWDLNLQDDLPYVLLALMDMIKHDLLKKDQFQKMLIKLQRKWKKLAHLINLLPKLASLGPFLKQAKTIYCNICDDPIDAEIAPWNDQIIFPESRMRNYNNKTQFIYNICGWCGAMMEINDLTPKADFSILQNCTNRREITFVLDVNHKPIQHLTIIPNPCGRCFRNNNSGELLFESHRINQIL